MKTWQIILILIAVITIKVIHDNHHWTNVDHVTGLILVALVLVPVSLIILNPWPLFAFAAAWNPAINLSRGLDFFYLGDTAKTDIILKQVLGDHAGILWFLLMVILTIISNIWDGKDS